MTGRFFTAEPPGKPTGYNVDETWGHYAAWSKPDTEGKHYVTLMRQIQRQGGLQLPGLGREGYYLMGTALLFGTLKKSGLWQWLQWQCACIYCHWTVHSGMFKMKSITPTHLMSISSRPGSDHAPPPNIAVLGKARPQHWCWHKCTPLTDGGLNHLVPPTPHGNTMGSGLLRPHTPKYFWVPMGPTNILIIKPRSAVETGHVCIYTWA